MSLINEINADVERRVTRFEVAVAEIVAVPDARLVALADSLTDGEHDLISSAVDQLEDAADSGSLGRSVPHWEAIFDRANGSTKFEKRLGDWRKHLRGMFDEDRSERVMTVIGAAQPYYLVPEALDARTSAAIASVLSRLGVNA